MIDLNARPQQPGEPSRPSSYEDLAEVRRLLVDRATDVVTELLGESPSEKHGDEWRWRDGKSFVLSVAGETRGLWYDHAHLVGGDLLDLIQRQLGGSFWGAVDWARDFLGHRPLPPVCQPVQVQPRHTTSKKEWSYQRACFFTERSQPIEGTVAEKYLSEIRSIPKPAGLWPDFLRYILLDKGVHALVIVIRNETGVLRGVQVVYLDDQAEKCAYGPKQLKKQSFGSMGVVRLPGAFMPLLIAEGPETALSLWAATGCAVWITFGSMAGVDPPDDRQVIICRDDDTVKAEPVDKALAKALLNWRYAGKDVCVATPWATRRHDTSDFNDVLRSHVVNGQVDAQRGIEAIRHRLKVAIDEAAAVADAATVQADAETLRVPLPLARDRVHAAVVRFFKVVDEVEAEDKARAKAKRQAKKEAQKTKDEELPKVEMKPTEPLPVYAVAVGLGIGKTHVAIVLTIEWLVFARRRGSRRNIAIAVPRHKLADELVKRIKQIAAGNGLQVRVWRGREADDPSEPEQQMCRDVTAILDVQKAYGDPTTQVCGIAGQDPRCALFDVCAYQRQARQSADIWIVPHEILFGPKPAAIGKLVALIVDESVWSKGLDGHEGKPIELTLDALSERFDLQIWLQTARLQNLYSQLRDLLNQHPDGPLSREALLAGGYSREMALEARQLTYERKRESQVVPGMSKAQRDVALKKVAAHNRTVMRLAQMFGALGHLLAEGGPEHSGWARLVTIDKGEGPQRLFHLRRRRLVGKGWQVPTLLMDATLDLELVGPYWPNVAMIERIEAEMPHARLRQFVGHEFAMSRLILDPARDESENRRRLTNSRELRAVLYARARQVDGKVLIIGYKTMIEEWRKQPMPGNVELAHHGAVAGEDRWKNVPLLVGIGRLEPGIAEIERMAETLTGAAVSQAVKEYVRTRVPLPGSHGTGALATVSMHPDPIAEKVRWQVAEGGILQGIGRARAVNRTEADPVEILILTSRLLPLPIDEVVTAEQLRPSMVDLMLGEGGVAFLDLADAWRVYPSLWPSADAARKAGQREAKYGTSPDRESLNRRCPVLLNASYQRAGQGKRPAQLWFDPTIVPPEELRPWLENRLGLLAVLEINPSVEQAAQVAAIVEPAPAPKPDEPKLTVWQVNELSLDIVVPRNPRGWDGTWTAAEAERVQRLGFSEAGYCLDFNMVPPGPPETWPDCPVDPSSPFRAVGFHVPQGPC